ncbi:hypothetical protein JCM3774_006133 [Rhodotorula dairenensis]
MATFSFGFGQPATSAPSLFGATPAPATSTALFGATSAPAPTASLFGASATSATPAPAPAPANLFGSTTTGLFGNAAPAPQTGSLFGQQPQPPQQPQQQQQQQQLFGQSQSAASASLFGSTSTPAPPPPPVPKLGDPLPLSATEPSIESRLVAIKDAWDPTSAAKCRFQTYFYNELPPGQTPAMYTRPVDGARRDEWDRATRENPDPERLIPALALGFPAVQHRLELQQRLNLQHQALLDQIHAHLDALSSTHALTTSLRTLRARQNAVALQARVTQLVARVGSGLAPHFSSASAAAAAAGGGTGAGAAGGGGGAGSGAAAVRGRDEDELRVRLESAKSEVDACKARTGELWARVGAVKARRPSSPEDAEAAAWAVADEDGLRQILEILSSQQSGLDHLTRTLQSMAKDVDVMNDAFGLPVGKILAAATVDGVVAGR